MDVETAVEPQTIQSTGAIWSPASRVAFRFCFVYFGLYCIGTQIINSVFAIPKVEVPDWGTLWPIRPFVFWVGAHVFGAKPPMIYSGSGSGDKTYDWVLMFCMLVASLLATALWTILDRKHTSYPQLLKWFWLFLRFCVAGQMFTYGLIKIFPLQMPSISLYAQVEPFGNFSPMGVLWSSISATPAYETFAGCAEFLGGLLLVSPRTITLGALVCLVDMVQVFVLNMTYDVPVKLLSFHLILMSLFLLSPGFPRLLNFFILNRQAGPSIHEPLFASLRRRRIASSLFVLLWAWMLVCNAIGVWDSWHQYGKGAPKPALYGIWDIEEYMVNGQSTQLLVTNNEIWRRMIFEYPGVLEVQAMNDTVKFYSSAVSLEKKTLSITDGKSKNWKSDFTITLPTPDTIVLDGTLDGRRVSLHLRKIDHTKFLLTSRGFHWVQEYPFNR